MYLNSQIFCFILTYIYIIELHIETKENYSEEGNDSVENDSDEEKSKAKMEKRKRSGLVNQTCPI